MCYVLCGIIIRQNLAFKEICMLYQAQHSVIADKITLEGGYNLNFPVHIHNSFEIIIAPEGEMEIFVGEKSLDKYS